MSLARSTPRAAVKHVLRLMIDGYVRLGRPLAPITRWVRRPMRWYFHRSKTLRHDVTGAWSSKLLYHVHHVFVGEHPADFLIHGGKLRFRSTGSAMAVHGYYVGEIEHHLVRFMMGRLSPGFVMLDVGAHHGAHSLVVAHELVGRDLGGRIVAFEPDPTNLELLRSNVTNNGLETHIDIRAVAVAERDGTHEILFSVEDNSSHTFVENRPYALSRGRAVTARVPTIHLDGLLRELPRVDLVKIDVQGAEPLVLAGAETLIRRHRPVLVVEAVPGWPSTERTAALLRAYEYDVYGLTAAGELCGLASPEVFVSWDWVGMPR